MTTKLASKWRLVGDPFAPESVWLPACAAEFGLSAGAAAILGGPTCNQTKVASTLAAVLRLSAALLLSGAFAYVAYMSVQLGFDWGYKFVERIFGQTAEADQAITASYALVFAVMPLVFGLAFGFFKSALSGTRRWYVAFIIAAVAYCAVICSPNDPGHLFTVWPELLPALPGLGFSLIGLSTGVCIYGALRNRMRLVPVVLSGFAAQMPVVFYVLQCALTLASGLTVYSLAMIIGSVCAAYLSQARDRVGAILMAMVALLPIIVVNLGNVVCNVLSLSLDNFHTGAGLGWRALLSACMISLLTFACAAVGGLIGFHQRARQ